MLWYAWRWVKILNWIETLVYHEQLEHELELYVSLFNENLGNFRWKTLKCVENMISLLNEYTNKESVCDTWLYLS